MRSQRFATTLVTAVLVASVLVCTGATAATKIASTEATVKAASKKGLYAVVTFYKRNDTASTNMLAEAGKLKVKHAGKAVFAVADVDSNVHQNMITHYSVDSSRAPVTLVIAPNGAVTGEFFTAIGKTDISDSFVSKGWADLLKVLQDGKLAAVCLQNAKTKFGKESLAAAEELKYGGLFRGALEVVKVDPSDKAEAWLTSFCQVKPGTENAQIVIVDASVKVLGVYDGSAGSQAITTDLVSKLRGSTCGGGTCGPGGCK